MRQELAANSKTVLQREVIKMSATAGRMPPEADSVERADLIEDENQANPDKISVDSDGNWNESFQSAREMPIAEFGLAMEKGMKLHRLRHKIVRLASVAVKTIIDEFALPRRLKKIKPLEWMDDLEGQEQDSRADLNVELEDMPNDLIYQYRSLLIRVLGISASRDDSQTFRKAAGNEVRGIHAFQEACTRVHQDMVARRLEKNGGLSKPIAVRDSPSRNGTSANGVPMLSSPYVTVVDYSGFRVLISTIPPIDEDHTLVHGRTDPQDPNSNFEDFDPAFSALLSAVAQELNLKEHKIIADGSVRIIPLSSEVQGHKCIDTRRYAVNLGRIMPPDLPHGGSDITTKLLRPEFVQAYCMPLSSDAFSSIIMPPQNDSSARLLDDLSGNDVDAGNASKYLRTQRIPEFVAKLDTLAIFPYESHTLTQAMHAHGINMRYLGRICELTKLPHVRELVTIEMLARTCKDVLNENMRKTIIGAHERVAHIIHDLASRGRHLNDEAMAKLLQFNRQLTEDTETNIVDFFNLVLGKSSDHENSLFWKNVLLPRVCEKFHFYHQEHHQKNEQGASDPLCIGREILNPCQLFHAMQYQCGVRFLASEHYDFNGLASPLKMSQIVDVYPKVKSPGNMALEVNRVAAAAEVYRDSGELDTALQAFRLRHNQVKNIDGLSSGIPCALAMNDIANTLRLQYHELRKKRLLYGSDGNASDSQVMLSDRQRLLKALSYTEEALQMVDSTHVVSARIHETRMRIFSDLGDTGELAVEFHTAISAALSHFGRSGMHPYVAELHCILGSLLASHDQIPNARKHLELARKLASRILGPRHLILASYTADVARIDMKDGDTFGAFEHYQQALMLIFQTIGRESLEAANILCEMARIKSMHGRQVGQLEAEEALRLAEQALRIRESCAMEEVGTDAHGSDEKEVLAAMRSDEVTVISALSQVSLSLNDMLVQSYSQVADLASNERRYERATECYERLLTCLRARSVKTEAALKLMQKASQEIIAIRLQRIGSEPAREIRRIHAMHDPHKSIHQKMPELFRQVVLTVSTESPGAYFDDLVTRANVHKNTAARLAGKSTEQTTPSRKISQEELEAERELACLVELSDAV
jgi:tetratricopeptide (TPR) repeat protein